MNKKRLSPKSVIFYKLYLINILITVAFICIISLICSTFSSKLILNNMISFQEEMIAEKSNALDERVKQLDEVVNTMIGEENVFRLLMTNESYYEKPTMLLKIIKYFQNICSNNSLIDGICLVDIKRGLMITEKTKISLSDVSYYDSYQRQNSFVIHQTEDGQTLEFVKKLEPLKGQKNVYMILTINQEMFTKNLLIGKESEMIKSYLLTQEGEALSVRGIDEIDPDIRSYLYKQDKATERIKTGNKNMVLYKNKSKVSDISLATVQDYTNLLKEAGTVKRMIIMVSLFMIAVATVIIYLCSFYVYKPLKQLGYKIQGMTVQTKQEDLRNEYRLIENVVNKLQIEREYAMPSVVKDSVNKLVTEIFDKERFNYLRLLLKQNMEFELNVLVIVECEEVDADKIVIGFMELIKNHREIEGFYSEITAARALGIFNTSLSYELFLAQIEDLRKQLEKQGITFTCCVSRGFKNWENTNLVYTEMLGTLERKFFKENHTLIYETRPIVAYKNEYYSKEMESCLTKYVTEGKQEEAIQTLNVLTKDLSNNATDIQYTRFVYFQICNNLIRNVLDLGGKLPKEFNEKDIFKAVFGADSLLDLEKMSEGILRICIDNFVRKENSYSFNVEKAVAFISANYRNDLSLDNVASAVFLSAGYLSIIFKEETGYTVLEYITYIRMQKAKELVLQSPPLRIKEISEQLGYNNVQSFIRYFKKHYSVTPMEFRKK